MQNNMLSACQRQTSVSSVITCLPVDVMFKLFDYQFLIIDDSLHHIADRHDADYLLVLQHWKMAHGSRGHDGHTLLDRLFWLRAEDLG